jgi:hypothetical protein
MKKLIVPSLLLALLLAGIAAYAAPMGAGMDPLADQTSFSNLTRSCQPKIGAAAQKLDASLVADADSGALNNASKYLLRCTTDHWIRFGSSAVTAVADDWLVEAGEVWELPTGGTQASLHISVLGKDVDGVCYIIECF